jgi:sulfide:quinone oxidoreductase
MDILIAGGGIAGLEALLALHAMAGDRVRLTLIARGPDFTYRPLAVAEPFSAGHPYRVPLTAVAEATGAELVLDAVVAVDDAAGTVRLSGGGTRSFDALLVAPGGRAVAGVEGASTWWPGGDPEHFGGLLRDIDEGYAKRLAIVVPAGAVWPLPAYELALMTAGEARAIGQDDVDVVVVTPERVPLALFGPEASAAVSDELRTAGIGLRTGVVGIVEPGGLRLEPGGEHLELQRVVAVPRVVGPGVEGLPADEDGFVRAGEDARVVGCERTWAAGDGVVSPVKFGGLATHQARRAAAGIARRGGVERVPDPGEPVLHGRLLVGRRSRRLRARPGASGAPLWWPGGKVAGEYLPRWLTQQGIAPAAAAPPAGGVTVRRPLREMSAEAQYVYELARRYGRRTTAVAALGGRGRPDLER